MDSVDPAQYCKRKTRGDTKVVFVGVRSVTGVRLLPDAEPKLHVWGPCELHQVNKVVSLESIHRSLMLLNQQRSCCALDEKV